MVRRGTTRKQISPFRVPPVHFPVPKSEKRIENILWRSSPSTSGLPLPQTCSFSPQNRISPGRSHSVSFPRIHLLPRHNLVDCCSYWGTPLHALFRPRCVSITKFLTTSPASSFFPWTHALFDISVLGVTTL